MSFTSEERKEFQIMATERINYFMENCVEFSNFLDNPNEENWLAITNNNNCYSYNDFPCGLTKGVMITEANFVIKFPFTNSACEQIKNYCDREVDNYNNLDAEGFGKFCAETIYIGDFSGEPAYIMEKCECDEEFVSSFSYKRIQMQIYREALENGTEEEAVEAAANDARIQDILWEYGEDEMTFEAMKNSWGEEEEDNITEFQNLCDECCINDLHAGNVGLLNGRMVLIDYSGYNN